MTGTTRALEADVDRRRRARRMACAFTSPLIKDHNESAGASGGPALSGRKYLGPRKRPRIGRTSFRRHHESQGACRTVLILKSAPAGHSGNRAMPHYFHQVLRSVSRHPAAIQNKAITLSRSPADE